MGFCLDLVYLWGSVLAGKQTRTLLTSQMTSLTCSSENVLTQRLALSSPTPCSQCSGNNFSSAADAMKMLRYSIVSDWKWVVAAIFFFVVSL